MFNTLIRNAASKDSRRAERSFSNSHQQGITFILVLIFIVSLSLIAAVAMRNVNTGERVVANERDRAIAFQGAESAGRDAIALVSAGGGALTALVPGYYATPIARGGNAEFWRTTSSMAADSSCTFADTTKRFDWASCAATSSANYGNKQAPQYVIEKHPDVVVSATVTEHWYRITTRAAGGSNEADVILQIMFTAP
jgi:Tfp pilus assembly protein PilX